MQIQYDQIKRRLTITSENQSESLKMRDIIEQMKKHDAAVNVTFPNGGTRMVITPPTARFVLAANQFYKEQTAR